MFTQVYLLVIKKNIRLPDYLWIDVNVFDSAKLSWVPGKSIVDPKLMDGTKQTCICMNNHETASYKIFIKSNYFSPYFNQQYRFDYLLFLLRKDQLYKVFTEPGNGITNWWSYFRLSKFERLRDPLIVCMLAIT